MLLLCITVFTKSFFQMRYHSSEGPDLFRSFLHWCTMFVGIGMYFAWPVVQNGIYALGGLVTGSGYLGTLIFGIIKRALIPFGLHHVFYMPFWQTAVGGTMEVAGQMVTGRTEHLLCTAC